LRRAAALEKKLLKLVMLNYIKYYTKIKENRRGLYTSKKKIINYYGICDNKIALIKTCLRKVDLSLAFFVKGFKKKLLKDLTEHINNYNRTKVINITLLFRIFAQKINLRLILYLKSTASNYAKKKEGF
jgi:hypothetical protein